MATVVITRNDWIEEAVKAVRHLWEAGRLGLGETDTDAMEFPALSLQQAIEEFTEAAYGRRLTFEHA
jgi:hypothetical protein